MDTPMNSMANLRLASDPVRVFVNVPQADVTSVKPGTPATIIVDEFPGQAFAGKVARDAGAFDQASRTLLLEIDVPNPDGRLFDGMYAHAKFALKNPTPALLVPDNSILIDSKGPRVLVVDSSDKVHVKPVTLGRDFGTKSEILGGLDTTDRVVQNPTHVRTIEALDPVSRTLNTEMQIDNSDGALYAPSWLMKLS